MIPTPADLGAGAADMPAATAVERLRAARATLTAAARRATPDAAASLSGAALAISAHEAALGALEEAGAPLLTAPAQAALEASAMVWAAFGASAASAAAWLGGPDAREAASAGKLAA